MRNSLAKPAVADQLARLFAAADEGDDAKLAQIAASHGDIHRSAASASERAEVFGSVYIPVSPETGRLMYSLIRASKPQTVVEFGTSFGIATLHLAAAVADNGTGRVITAELNRAKAEQTRQHLTQAGLADVVDIVIGDALQTLADLPGPVGFVLLDGWKELYLDMLRVLEPKLSPGALVVADDTDAFASVLAGYLDYVRTAANGYVSTAFPMGDGVEVSCRV
jgi:predicted O-methyltransferase YrrM